MKRCMRIVVTGVCGLLGVSGAASAAEPMLDFVPNARVEMAQNQYSSLTNLTLSAWIKTSVRPAPANSYGAIAGRGHLTANNGFGLFVGGDGKLYFQTRSGATQVNAITDYPFDNVWHHVAGVRDGNVTRLYLDGNMTNEVAGALNTFYTAGVAFALGMRQQPSTGVWSFPFSGTISDVQLWDHARSGEQIRTDMFRRLAGTETGLAGYWPLNEGGGITARDLTPTAQNGACVNTFWSSDVVLGGMLSTASGYLGHWPFTLGDWETGSTRVTDSNWVAVSSFPVPSGYNAYQLGASGASSSATNGWLSANVFPAQASLEASAGRASVYAWFTNTTASVPLRRSTASIMYLPENAALDFRAVAYTRVTMTTNLYPSLVNLTLSAWVKTAVRPAPGRWAALAGRGSIVGVNGFGLYLDGTDGKVYFQTRTSATAYSASTAYPFDGAWHHVAGVREGTVTRLYLDGVLMSAVANSIPSIYTAGIAFGLGMREYNGVWGYPYDGFMAEVRLWNQARSTTQIQAEMFQCLAGTETGLVGYWPLTEGTGTAVTDRTDAGNDGLCVNDPRWMTDEGVESLLPVSRDPALPGAWPFTLADLNTSDTRLTDSNKVNVASFPIPQGYNAYQFHLSGGLMEVNPANWVSTNTAPGMLSLTVPTAGGCSCAYAWFTNTAATVPLRRAGAAITYAPGDPGLNFSPTLSRVQMGAVVIPDLTNLTLSVWLKTAVPPAFNSYHALAGQGYLAPSHGFGLYLNGADGKVYFQTRTNETIVQASAPYPFDGAWHHVAGVREGDVTRLYLDGDMVSEAAGALPSLSADSLAFGLGARHAKDGWSFYYPGVMTEVRLWSYARSVKEIRSDRYYRLEGDEAGLIGYWPLDEGEGQRAYDRTVGGNNGALFGPEWEFTADFIRDKPPQGTLIKVR